VQVSVDCLANDSGSTVTLFFLKTLLFAILPLMFSLLAVSLILLGVLISKRFFDKEISKETRNATLVTANIVFLFSSFSFFATRITPHPSTASSSRCLDFSVVPPSVRLSFFSRLLCEFLFVFSRWCKAIRLQC
jgi:hypothetical protein